MASFVDVAFQIAHFSGAAGPEPCGEEVRMRCGGNRDAAAMVKAEPPRFRPDRLGEVVVCHDPIIAQGDETVMSRHRRMNAHL